MRLHPDDVKNLSVVDMATLIASGFVTDWPHEWTRAGRRHVKRNTGDDGRWNGAAVLYASRRAVFLLRPEDEIRAVDRATALDRHNAAARLQRMSGQALQTEAGTDGEASDGGDDA